MAVNTSRSQNQSLSEGATDGKYRKVRPDTQVNPGTGGEVMLEDRSHLHPWWGYGTISRQLPTASMVVPGR